MPRVPALDYLKILLASGVILAHALLISNHVTYWSFIVGLGVLRSIVPTFSVISGYFLYSIYKKGKLPAYIKRLALLYLFWTLFYAPLWLRDDQSLRHIAGVFVNGFQHLWYVVGLLVAAFIAAAMLALGRRTGAGNRPLAIAAVVCATGGILLNYVAFFTMPELPMEFYHNGVFIIFPFVTMGYFIADRIDHRGMESLPAMGILIAATLVVVVLKLIEADIVIRHEGLSMNFFPEFPILQYLMALTLFLAFLRMKLPQARVDLGYYSAIMYFLHIGLQAGAMHVGFTRWWMLFLIGAVGSIVAAAVFSFILKYGSGKKRAGQGVR